MEKELELFNAQSGSLSARVIIDSSNIRHIHSLVKPESESDFFKDLEFWGETIVFLGVGLGYHLSEKVKEIPKSARVIVIEFFKDLLDHTLKGLFHELNNSITAISSENYNEETSSNILTSLTGPVQVIKHPASHDVNKEFYEKCMDTISARKGHGPGPGTKKFMVLKGGFFLEDECLRALPECGMLPASFEYKELEESLRYESALHKTIQKERPSFVLSVNMLGFDDAGILQQSCSRFGIPLIVWFVDDPHPILQSQPKIVNSNMTAFTWERSYISYLKNQGFTAPGYLPLATAPDQWPDGPPAKMKTELGFVGSPMGGAFLERLRSRFMYDYSLDTVVERTAESLLASPQNNIHDLLQNNLEKTGANLPFSDNRNITWLCSYIIHTASMKKRRAMIESLAGTGIEIFGDQEDWRKVLSDCPPIHPPVSYGKALGQVYSSTAINLNTTSCQMQTTVNQRVFDIPLCHSLVITDHQKDMEELFDVEKEAVTYKTLGELKEKIDYFKNNREAAKSIIAAGRKRILSHHTLKNRLETIIKEVS